MTCLNCGTALTGRYCANCGQKAGRPVLTTREILRELTHELAHWDGKLPATLRALFTKPGLLTADVLAGRRARWLPPLRVYLICSLAFFAIKPTVEAATGRSPRQYAQIQSDIQPGQPLTPAQREELGMYLPAKIFGVDRIERAIAKGSDFSREAEAAFPKAMFVLLPLFAVLMRLAWRRKRPEYVAHLIAALHIHAVIFGSLAAYWIVATLIPSAVFAVAAYFFMLGYWTWYCLTTFRRLYGESWVRTVAKTVGIVVPYWALLMITGFVIMALTLLGG